MATSKLRPSPEQHVADVVTVDAEGKRHLAAPARELVDEYLQRRVAEVLQNDIERWVDARWDKKREWFKTVLSWGSLTALIAAGGLIWTAVQTVVSSQVGPAIEAKWKPEQERLQNSEHKIESIETQAESKIAEAKEKIDRATADAAGSVAKLAALSQTAEADTANAKKQVENAANQFAIQYKLSTDLLSNSLESNGGKIRAVTAALDDLFKRYPREAGGVKEQLEFPLGSIVLVQPDNVKSFVGGHLEWIASADSKFFDASEAKWTLVDHRPVPNSAYAKELGFPQVPDGSPLAAAASSENFSRANFTQKQDADTKTKPVILIKINY